MEKEKNILSDEELEKAAGGVSINRACGYFEPKSNDPVAALAARGCPNCAHYKSDLGGFSSGSCELGH